MPEGIHAPFALRQCSKKRIDRVLQVLPGKLGGLLCAFDLLIARLLQLFDAPLEFREAVAHILQLPAILEFDANLMLFS